MPKFVVLLKQTLDTEEKIIVTDQGIDDQQAKYVINPYDEYALEEALQQRDQHGGQVLVVTCGTDRADEALRTALAVGADEAIRLDSAGLSDDSFVIASALAAVVKPLEPDLVLAGLFAVDSGSGSVALQLAERLRLPHASAAVKLTLGTAQKLGIEPLADREQYALVKRDVEGDVETVSIPLPALITAQQGLNEPRYPSLPGIMKAKKKPLRVITAEELRLSLGSNDSSGSSTSLSASGTSTSDASVRHSQASDSLAARTIRSALYAPPPRAAGIRLTGTAHEQTAELVARLQNL